MQQLFKIYENSTPATGPYVFLHVGIRNLYILQVILMIYMEQNIDVKLKYQILPK